MIKSIRIRNFKCLSDFELEVKPLTVICGANSVGKSSIGQALLMMKQSNQQSGSLSMLYPTGDLVKLGGYPDFVLNHDVEKQFEIEIEIADSDISVIKYQNVKSTIINLSYIYNAKEERIELIGISITLNDNIFVKSQINKDKTFGFKYRLIHQKEKTQRINPHITSLTDFINPTKSRQELLKRDISNSGFETINLIYYFLSGFLSSLENELNNLTYLGPFREPPERTYTTGGAKPDGIGTRGQFTINYMTYSTVADEDGLVEFTKKWLSEFGYLSDFSINKIHGLISTTRLVNKNTGVDSTLLDVGFGISQILPVIAAIYLHKKGLHIFEQPEIHLHPVSQADLADLFISAIAYDKYYLIETHSEHFINRLRTRVAQGEISPEKICILYLRNRTGELEVEEISLLENGSFKGLPDDFFGEALNETRAIMEARRQRKLF